MLRALYGRANAPAELLALPLARALTEATRATRRRVGLLLDRQGRIEKVIVGDAHRVFLPDLGARRAGAARFRGVRLILSSLRPDGLSDEDLTDLVLLQLDAVVTLHARDDGLPGSLQVGYLLPPDDESERPWRVDAYTSLRAWRTPWLTFIGDLEAQFARSPQLQRISRSEGAILVGVTLGDPRGARRRMTELERLATTAGFEVLDRTLQNRAKLDGRTCVGSGKLQELILHSMHLGATALLFDRELSPSQLRNIATLTDLKVLDRTQVILDIFAQHALSREGKLQVELAQLRYRMPRVAIMPTAMSRLTGGIGGRGPGETKLEINRRRAQERLTRLERDLEVLGRNRTTRRKRRQKASLPVIAIVGYTNAGKSTLLNRLTRSDVLVEDKLFATLDPTTRRFRFPKEREIILTDTVGFIEGLPRSLVRAFKSTLEEVEVADLLLHVLDAGDDAVEAHHAAVQEILQQLGVEDKPILTVWNKAETCDPLRLRELTERYGGLAISALEGRGLDRLLRYLESQVFRTKAHQSARQGSS